jgi:FkbM family methyltransferase
VNFLKRILKIPLDLLSFLLKRNSDALYYLVNESLRDEIKSTSEKAFAYQHIENAVVIAQNLKITEGVILDVGGGTASTAVIFSKYFPNIPIYIFEPLEENFNIILKTAQKNAHWIPVNKAVGSQIGTTNINIAHRSTASSLLEMNASTEGYGDMLVLQKKETIKITTLDSEVPDNQQVIILKMDVQGFELEVLKGAIQTLQRTAIVVMEVNNHDGYKGAPTYYDLDSFMRLNGFVLYDIVPNAHFNGKLQDWDAIYVNKKHLLK